MTARLAFECMCVSRQQALIQILRSVRPSGAFAINQMVGMASTAPVSGRCRGPLPFTDCSPSRPGTLSRQHAVAACRQPHRTVTCSAHESSGHQQQTVSEILRSAAVGLAAAASIALPMTMLPDQVPLPPSPPDPQIPSSWHSCGPLPALL